MNKKIKIAAIKFAFFANGGTEKFIQTIVSNLPKDKFEVDVYYTNAAPYIGSDWKHPSNDINNISKLKGINLIPVHVDYKDITKPNHPWIGSNFFELFNENKYDIIITARAGHSEYPYNQITTTPIVELVTLPNHVDFQHNIVKTIHISEFQKNEWIKLGGNISKTEIIPIFSERLPQNISSNLRKEFNIPKDDFVFGFHQREDDGIYTDYALEAYKKVMNNNTWFIVMGGSKLYSKFVKDNNLKNFIQLEHSGDLKKIKQFLLTLNVFTANRADGETGGLSAAEALQVGLPVIYHKAPAMGLIETVGSAGFLANSIDEYSQHMRNVMNDKELYKNLSNIATNHYNNNLSLDTNINKFITIFENIFKENGKYTLDGDDFWNSIYE